MKKTLLIFFLCFLFVGPTPRNEEWTIFLLEGTEYSGVCLLRIEGDNLVATFDGNTLFVPIEEISEIFTSSHPLEIPGCWVAYGVGGAMGAGCAAIGAEDGDKSKG